MALCSNGEYVSIGTTGSNCGPNRGQRLQCPRYLPKMCATQTCGPPYNNEHCCAPSAQDCGSQGLRPCPDTTTTSTNTKTSTSSTTTTFTTTMTRTTTTTTSTISTTGTTSTTSTTTTPYLRTTTTRFTTTLSTQMTTTTSITSSLMTILNSTTIATVLEGALYLNVSNVSQFVHEPNVTALMKIAIAELCDVNDSWIARIDVSRISLRRLDKTVSSYEVDVGEARVEFQVVVPPIGQPEVIATTILKKFDLLTRSKAAQAINKILRSGLLKQPYNAIVTRKYIFCTWCQSAVTLAPTPASKGDTAPTIVFIVVACCGFLMSILGVVGLLRWRQRTKKVQEPSRGAKPEEPETPGGKCAKEALMHASAEGVVSCSLDDFLKVPSTISHHDGEFIRKFARSLVDVRANNAQVFITYAIGQRSKDAPSVGPGMFHAAALTKLCFDNGIACVSRLALPLECDENVVNSQIACGGLCKVLLVLQTKALYNCMYSLKEIHAALLGDASIFPLRFEEDLPAKNEEWPQVNREDLTNYVMLAEVQGKFGALNSIPSPPYTVPGEPSVLQDVVTDIKRRLREHESSRKKPCPSVLGSSSDRNEAQHVGSLIATTSGNTSGLSLCSSPVKSEREVDPPKLIIESSSRSLGQGGAACPSANVLDMGRNFSQDFAKNADSSRLTTCAVLKSAGPTMQAITRPKKNQVGTGAITSHVSRPHRKKERNLGQTCYPMQAKTKPTPLTIKTRDNESYISKRPVVRALTVNGSASDRCHKKDMNKEAVAGPGSPGSSPGHHKHKKDYDSAANSITEAKNIPRHRSPQECGTFGVSSAGKARSTFLASQESPTRRKKRAVKGADASHACLRNRHEGGFATKDAKEDD